jgi:hypothetical protein
MTPFCPNAIFWSLTLALAMTSSVLATTIRVDLASNSGSAANWDVFTGATGAVLITDWAGGIDNDVTLSITPSAAVGGNNAGAPGTSATVDVVTVPKEARDDYFFNSVNGGSILMEIANLDAGTYNVSVFEGRTTDGNGQFAKVWVGTLGAEPGAQNTGDYAGSSATLSGLTVSAGQSVFIRHLENFIGGTSGFIIRELVVDTQAPTPDPMTFASPPTAVNDSEITMTATTASDASGVEYFFSETTGNPGGSDSGWQASPVYTDTGLDEDTAYSYTVVARDLSTNQNTTAASAAESATTLVVESMFLIDLSTQGGSAAGWDAFAFSGQNTVGPTTLTDQLGADNDVALTIQADGALTLNQSNVPGNAVTPVDGVTVPAQAYTDYMWVSGGGAANNALFEFQNLDPGSYRVSLFEGRVEASQQGKVWVGALGDEPGPPNTGNYAGSSQTVAGLTIGVGDSLFFRQTDPNDSGGTSGLIVKRLVPAFRGTVIRMR